MQQRRSDLTRVARSGLIGVLAGVVIAGAFTAGLTLTRPSSPPVAGAAGDAARRGEVAAILARQYYRPIDASAAVAGGLPRLSSRLSDPYTKVYSPAELSRVRLADDGRYGGIGVHLTRAGSGIVLDGVTPLSPAGEGGLRRGDALVAVDGVPVAGRSVAAVSAMLRGLAGTDVRVSLRHGSQARELKLTRRVLQAVVLRTQLLGDAGVIRLADFSEGVGARVRAATRRLMRRGARRIVLDLRGNPGGYVAEAVRVASAFVPSGSVVVRQHGLHLAPLTLRTAARPVSTRVALAVLVDGLSASSAEIVAGALRDHHRAVIVGSRTFGKGVIQHLVDLPSGGALKLTVSEYTTPHGERIQHHGILPDVPARTRRGPDDDAPVHLALRALAET